jgi:HPt (histidine-containing phosphotransfer) domain-containing protein
MATAIDRAVFAELQATAGDEFVRELVATFLTEAPAMLAELEDALGADDADRFRRTAHSLKSNANTFGARTLGEKARALELGGIASARAQGVLAALEAEYRHVADALRELARG